MNRTGRPPQVRNLRGEFGSKSVLNLPDACTAICLTSPRERAGLLEDFIGVGNVALRGAFCPQPFLDAYSADPRSRELGPLYDFSEDTDIPAADLSHPGAIVAKVCQSDDLSVCVFLQQLADLPRETTELFDRWFYATCATISEQRAKAERHATDLTNKDHRLQGIRKKKKGTYVRDKAVTILNEFPTNVSLRKICCAFQISVNGTRDVLRKRILKYADKNPTEWVVLRHLGSCDP